MCLLADLLCFAQGLLTPVIAIIAVYIAYQQSKTNEQKLKLDLYNKRFHVYKEVAEIIRVILNGVDTQDIIRFQHATSEAVFLFESDISEYIDEICK